jgi:hypothetical protein
MLAAIAALLLPVMAFAGPLDFTFSLSGTYNWTFFQSTYLNAGFGSGGGGILDFNMGSRQMLPTAPTQSLATGDSFYYYLFALPLNDGGGIAGTEVGNQALTIAFGTNLTSGFSLAIPIVAVAGSGYNVSASSMSQSQLVSGSTYLTARIRFDDGVHSNAVDGHIDNNTPNDLGGTYNWTTSTAGGHVHLQLTNENIGEVEGVPEPATFVLLGSALVGLGLLHRRKRA